MSEKINIKPGARILVSRTDRLGDLILALPVVETIAKRYPDNPVDVLASLYASPILENNPAIAKIIRVQNDQLRSNKLYRKDFLHRLKMNKYEVVVVMYPDRHISRLFHRASIPHRIGTMGRFHSVFFNHRLAHSRKANKKHECEYNLDYLKYFHDGETINLPQVYPMEKDIRNAKRILTEVGINRQFVAIHPCSGGSADRWPMERFIQLANKLTSAGWQIVLSGSADEQSYIESSLKGDEKDIVNIAGETDLRTLAAVLSLAETLIANSTGPLHLASAVGTKVIGLYPSKRIMSPVRWGPLGGGHQVIQPPSSQIANDLSGMSAIEVDYVAQQVLDSLGNTKRELT